MTKHNLLWFAARCLPRSFCGWLWSWERIPLGGFAPYIVGRILNSEPHPVT